MTTDLGAYEPSRSDLTSKPDRPQFAQHLPDGGSAFGGLALEEMIRRDPRWQTATGGVVAVVAGSPIRYHG
jgi:hypothetical protein